MIETIKFLIKKLAQDRTAAIGVFLILSLILVAIFAPLFCYLGYESIHRLAKISHRTFYFLETIFFLVLAINIYYNHILI